MAKRANTNFTIIALDDDLFGENTTAHRRKPLKMKQVVIIGRLQQEMAREPEKLDELVAQIAKCYPEWYGVIDGETGITLPHPKDNPSVLLELEPAQFQWLGGKGLAEPPLRGPRKTNKPVG